MNNGEQPAYPTIVYGVGNEVNDTINGLTKREYFAAMAMQGILSGSTDNHALVQGGDFNTPHIALKAVQLADELLKQLETK